MQRVTIVAQKELKSEKTNAKMGGVAKGLRRGNRECVEGEV